MANNMTKLDANQVLKSVYDEANASLKSVDTSSLVPEKYNEIALAYTGSDLTTVTYKNDGDTVATLTLTYSGGLLANILRV